MNVLLRGIEVPRQQAGRGRASSLSILKPAPLLNHLPVPSCTAAPPLLAYTYASASAPQVVLSGVESLLVYWLFVHDISSVKLFMAYFKG